MNNYSANNETISLHLMELLRYVNAEKRVYRKNDVITDSGENQSYIGLLSKGLAYLVSINSVGEKNILDYYQSGEVIGSPFFPHKYVNLYYITARTDCNIYICSYQELMNLCKNEPQKYADPINRLILSMIVREQTHTDILSQRTIRNKLLTYFRYIAENNGSTEISLPMTLADVADYISVDRSAMMREIKKMNADNIICSKGQKITLL